MKEVYQYGARGIGKTTLMQAILWHGLYDEKQNNKFLPINVRITGTNSVSNQSEIEDAFYREVLSGLISVNSLKDKHEKIKSAVSSHVPWLASSVVNTLGLIFPPIAIGSSVTQIAVKKLLKDLNRTESGSMSFVMDKNIQPKMAVDFIIEHLKNDNIHPVFVIDELDKAPDNRILYEFFNGNQGWFQGKRTIISLSYIFGRSVEKEITESLGRFSQAQEIEGTTAVKQFRDVLHARLLLGISKIEPNESKAIKAVQNIFSDDVIEEIVNRYVPNIHLMLKHSYDAISKAISRKSTQVTLDDLPEFESTQNYKLRDDELKILRYLSKEPMSPKELIKKTDKTRGGITHIIKSLYSNDLIEKTGQGKNVKYTITRKGDAARFHN